MSNDKHPRHDVHDHAHDHPHHGVHDHAHDHPHHGVHDHAHDHPHHGVHDHAHDHPHHGVHDHAHDHPHHGVHDHPHHGGFGAGFRVATTPPGERRQAERDAGVGKILYFDAASGAAGDMIVASLVDLGVPFSVVEQALSALDLDGYELGLRFGYCGSIGAAKFDVAVVGKQPQRSYADITKLLQTSRLKPRVLELAMRVFSRLARAEAEVHRVAVESVHFHEVGAVDSIVDIVGAAACLEYLGAEIWVSALPMGRGFVECQHGRIPLPAPATLGCLRGLATCDAGIEAELVTPTGAAILGALATGSVAWPRMSPRSIGWGAGTRTLPDRPNLLRVILGEPSAGWRDGRDNAVLLQANLDDATGELLGYVTAALLRAGALDVWAEPVTMKKGRPGVVLSVLAAPEDAERLSVSMLRETTTIGVRQCPVSRVIRPRHTVEVQTKYGVVPVKVSNGDYGPPQLKPEFEVCVQLAESTGQPLREILAEAQVAARKRLDK